MVEQIINYDAQASPVHSHRCLNPQHSEPRTWTCTRPHCIGGPAWGRCEVCDPPPYPPPPPCVSGCPCPARVTPLQVSVWSA